VQRRDSQEEGMGRFEGKVVVVTGAGSGIGRTSAETFATEGAKVVCVDLESEALAATAAEIGGAAVAGSVGEPETWRAVVEAARRLGPLGAAHLNAGVYGWTGAIQDLPDDVYRRTVAANVDGVVFGVRALVPLLREAGGGGLVATASVAGLVSFPPNAIYTLTKHAVVGFVRALAPSLALEGIGFAAVCPGVVDTPMTVEATGANDLSPADLPMPLIPTQVVVDAVVELAAERAEGTCRAVLHHGTRDWEFAGWERLAPEGGGAR
jgi:NAD(P)-dependent dehydrogenase (short-subunit alcohol dehydrogenase family)